MKEVARLLGHIRDVAGPHRDRQQHHVHRRETRDGEALQQPFGLGALVGFGALGRERMGAIADAFERLDDAGGVDLVVAPEVEPCIDHARKLAQSILDLANAAGAADALDR